MFTNLLLVMNPDKVEAFKDDVEDMMKRYYDSVDSAEERRLRDIAKQKFNEIMKVHSKNEASRGKCSYL